MRTASSSYIRSRIGWLLLLLLIAGGWAGLRWVEREYLPQFADRFEAVTGYRVEIAGLGPGWHGGPQLRARGVTLHHPERPEPLEIAAIGWSWRISDLLAGRFTGHIELEQVGLDARLPPALVRLGLLETAEFRLTRATLTPVTEAGQTRFTGSMSGLLNRHPYTAEFDFGTRESLERGALDDFRLIAQLTERSLRVELEGQVEDLFDWRGVSLTAQVRDLVPADWVVVRRAGLGAWLADTQMSLDARLQQPGDRGTARVEDLRIAVRGEGIHLSARGRIAAPLSAAGLTLDIGLDGRWTADQTAARGLPELPTEFSARASLSGGAERWVVEIMRGEFDWPHLGLDLDGRSEWRAGKWGTPLDLSVRHLDLPGLGDVIGYALPAVDDWRATAVWAPGTRRIDEISVELNDSGGALQASGAFEWSEAGPALNLQIDLDTRNPSWLPALFPSLSGLDSVSPLDRVRLSAELEHGPGHTELRALRFNSDSRVLQLSAEGGVRIDWPSRSLQALALDLSGRVLHPEELLGDRLPTAAIGGLPPLDYRARLDWTAGGTIDLREVSVTGEDPRGSIEWNGLIGGLDGQIHWRGHLSGRLIDPEVLRPWLPERLAKTNWATLLPFGFAADLDSVEHPLGLVAVELASETQELRFGSDHLDLMLGVADWRGEYRGALPLGLETAANNPVVLVARLPMRSWKVRQAEEIEARFDGPSGASLWRGQVMWSGGESPHWQAVLEADRLNWSDWSDRKDDERWFPEKAWSLGWLGTSTGSVEVEVERFSNRWLSGQALALQANWGERRLALSGRLGFGEGQVDLDWSLDAARDEPNFALRIAGDQLDSSYFMSADGEPWLSDGRVDLEIALRGRGTSPAAMAADADGRVFIRALDSRVDFSDLDRMGKDTLHQMVDVLLNVTNPLDDQEVALHCAVLNLDFVDGVAESESMLDLITDNIVGRGRGRIELGGETMDVVLSTRPRTGLRLQLNPLARLVRLSGPLANPVTSLDVTGLIEISAALATGGWTLLGRWLIDLSQTDEGFCASTAPEPSDG